MKHLIYIFLAVLLFGCSEQEPHVKDHSQDELLEVDYIYRPLLHHFSSTGCGPCGRFGIPLFTQVADQMGDSILPLITHFKYNDPFINPSSQAIEQAILEQWYSPQIWVDMDDITFSILYDELDLAIEKTAQTLREKISSTAGAYLGLKAQYNTSERYNIELVIENGLEHDARLFVEVYAMEDSLIASQAGADPFVSTHYKVNRGGFYGGMGKELNLKSNEQLKLDLEFIPCWVCAADKQYFYAIIWKEVSQGRFEYVNGKALKL